MAYSPKSTTPALSSATAAIGRDGAIGISLEKDSRRAQKENSARIQAIQTIHALDTFGPVLGHAISSSDNEIEQAQWLLSVLRQSHVFAHQVFSELDLEESETWALAVLERVFIEAWSKTGTAPSIRLIQATIEAHRRSDLSGFIERGSEEKGSTVVEPETRVRMAWFESMSLVSSAQQQFDFFRPDAEKDLLECADKLWNFAVEAVRLILDEQALAVDRAAVLECLLRQAGIALESSWLAEGQRAQAALQQKNKADVAAWKKANPQGFPLTTVFLRFEQQTRRLLLLSRQAPPATNKTKK